MAAYYVNSAAGGTNTGNNWTNAFTTFGAAVTAATASGDVIYVNQGHTENLAADTTYTFANNVSVICSNDTTNTPPQTVGSMGTSAWIGNNSVNRSITLGGAYKIYLYGMTFRIVGGSTDLLTIGTDDSHIVMESCYLWQSNTSTASHINLGGVTSNNNVYIGIKDCVFRLGNASQRVNIRAFVEMDGCSLSSSGAVPDSLFAGSNLSDASGSLLIATGCDFDYATTNLVSGASTSISAQFIFSNCKIGSGATVVDTFSPANKSGASVWLYNCASGDTHYNMSHYDALGSTIVDTGIYANDGAQYDGTNCCSWKITSTANCSYYTPYVSPWIDCYHSGTSAITPYLEILRDGSATAYQDDEVWGEFSYQGTTGFPLATIVSDRKALLVTAADQAAGVGTSGWTGDTGAWSGKLQSPSITPAEIGHLRARVCVGEPSITVYADPAIRGRS